MTGSSSRRATALDSSKLGRAALSEVEDRWNAAASSWNPDALAAVYAEDAALFGGRPGHAVGREQIRGYFASYAGVLSATTLTLTDQYVVSLGPDTIASQGYARFDMALADGKRASAVLRISLVLTRRDGRWLLLQHHASAIPDAPPIPD